MRRDIAAALSIVILTGPAGAVDLGVGLQGGGVGIGTSLSVGRDGTSLGVGTSLGGLGGVDAGASVGTTKAGPDASVGVGGRVGGTSVGVSGSLDGTSGVNAGVSVGTDKGGLGASVGTGGVGVGVSGRLDGASGGLSAGTGTTSSSAVGGAGTAAGDAGGRTAAATSSKGTGTVSTDVSVAPVEGVRQTIALPWKLRPLGGSGRMPAAIEVVPGTPSSVVSACREAIESAATPFGMVRVGAKSAGTLRRLSQGAVSAPIQVRIHYARQGGTEIRQARIKCQLDATGRVIKLI